MNVSTLSSRQFNQDTSKAKKAALKGPVIITDRGRPAHVLMTFDAYKKMTGAHARIADLLAMPGVEGIAFEAPRPADVAKPADFD
ncbi:MAG: type II toxin-antitoxin system Phd/YefM family antitoxin [Ramlibacter sp.]